ncbi:MAG: hypothetical protein IPG04_40710 [Polyangiaceae bacterium]|nr:hypothetical protein [Polyangiaceae bacterium]
MIAKLTDKIAIRIACVLVLLSLSTTVWAVVHPAPLVVIFAMSVGQGLGVLGVGFYLLVVFRDLWLRLKLRRSRQSGGPPSAPASSPGESVPPSSA